MRILVTGGAGFIGANLVDTLMQDPKNEVICVDNYFTGRKSNVEKWIGNPRFELIRHDVTDKLQIEVDQIYHLACPASPPHYQHNPIKTLKTSFFGALHMLELAQEIGARFLLASTSEIYGDPLIHPQKEDYWGNVNPNGIRSCYDEGKRVSETLAFDFHRYHGVEIRIARIFNTYGTFMLANDGRVVCNFVVQALQDKPLTVYGKGNQTRSFCYVTDTVDGLIRLMNHPTETGPVNIGNPSEFTVLELAEMVRKAIKPSLEIIFKELPKDDPTRRKPDITKAKTILGWEPKISIDQGLQKTIEYFKNELKTN